MNLLSIVMTLGMLASSMSLAEREAECTGLSRKGDAEQVLVTGKIKSAKVLKDNRTSDCFFKEDCANIAVNARLGMIITHTNQFDEDQRVGVDSEWDKVERIEKISAETEKYYSFCGRTRQKINPKSYPGYHLDHIDTLRLMENEKE